MGTRTKLIPAVVYAPDTDEVCRGRRGPRETGMVRFYSDELYRATDGAWGSGELLDETLVCDLEEEST